ncbi:MAG TPA: hypothetical protein PLU39_07740 [Armatimonadota bacterium]|nr:hypothetical protein [Armatimonadota bacterium]
MVTPVFVRNASAVAVPEDYQSGIVVDVLPQADRSTVSQGYGKAFTRIGVPTTTAFDFLLFATAVYTADKTVLRAGARDSWTRQFSTASPVRSTDAWGPATGALTEALTFLTGDEWHLDWYQGANRPWGMGRIRRPPFDAVCLFSGGLDSLCGAIDLLEDPRRLRVLLIGHHDSTLIVPVQRTLAGALARHYGPLRVHFVDVFVRPSGPRARQRYPLPTTRESTTRSRSLLFIALGLAAASARGQSIPLYVPENGFIALNAPMVAARRGSCSTRTTHPYFLDRLSSALASAGIVNPIINPYQELTKGEVVAHCRNQEMLGRLIHRTISCAHPEQGRYDSLPYGNCGYCFPCIIRRASIQAAGLSDATPYHHDICTEMSVLQNEARGSDARAVFHALRSFARDGRSLDRALLSAGPVPEPALLRALQRVLNQGLAELHKLLWTNASAEVRRFASL